MTPYNFLEQKRVGLAGERVLDRLFSRWYRVYPALDHQQRRGIDRIFRKGRGPKPWTFAVEYKTDRHAHTTGNAFIETVSVDTQGVKGWAYTSEANYVAIYVPGARKVYVVFMNTIRDNMAGWEAQYPHRDIANDTYVSSGVLVPLSVIAAVATVILDVPEELCKDRTDLETTRGGSPGQNTSPESQTPENRTLAPIAWEHMDPYHMPVPPRIAKPQRALGSSLTPAGTTPTTTR